MLQRRRCALLHMIVGLAVQTTGLLIGENVITTIGLGLAFVGMVLQLDKSERQYLWKRKGDHDRT